MEEGRKEGKRKEERTTERNRIGRRNGVEVEVLVFCEWSEKAGLSKLSC